MAPAAYRRRALLTAALAALLFGASGASFGAALAPYRFEGKLLNGGGVNGKDISAAPAKKPPPSRGCSAGAAFFVPPAALSALRKRRRRINRRQDV